MLIAAIYFVLFTKIDSFELFALENDLFIMLNGFVINFVMKVNQMFSTLLYDQMKLFLN